MASGTTRVDSSSGPAENGRTDEPASTARRPPRVGDFLGKHRLSAAIGRLHQEIQSLESELEELDKMEPSSAACNDRRFRSLRCRPRGIEPELGDSHPSSSTSLHCTESSIPDGIK